MLNFNRNVSEPFRFFFPLGTFFFLWGILLWLPLIWQSGEYPVILHRYLMLNGFTASFIAGFLMTAVPRFSGSPKATYVETSLFFLITLSGIFYFFITGESLFVFSALQPFILLVFLFLRIGKRKQNPPYSFIFIFVGLLLWLLSAIGSYFGDPEIFSQLHYEGAVASIIFGVGSRLIPGILGHEEIVADQRKVYEAPVPLLKTIPLSFFLLIVVFAGSYFLQEWGSSLRALVAISIALKYWRLYLLPKDRSALTYCIWVSAWLITLSFVLRATWADAGIHASHAFFIHGIALMSFLIATRVLQSHGPGDKKWERSRVLYIITIFIVLAGATRVSAFLLPEYYLAHLGYSSILLAIGAIIWSVYYLPFVFVNKISISSRA